MNRSQFLTLSLSPLLLLFKKKKRRIICFGDCYPWTTEGMERYERECFNEDAKKFIEVLKQCREVDMAEQRLINKFVIKLKTTKMPDKYNRFYNYEGSMWDYPFGGVRFGRLADGKDYYWIDWKYPQPPLIAIVH